MAKDINLEGIEAGSIDEEVRQQALILTAQDGEGIEALLYLPARGRPETALVAMHPATQAAQNYAGKPFAREGYAFLNVKSRYAGDDSTLIFEEVLLDIAAGVQFLRDAGMRRIVMYGHSGGASLTAYYQSQAESPSVTCTPAGDLPDLTKGKLPPGDAVFIVNSHPGRSTASTLSLDPSVIDERDPWGVDPTLDMFNPANYRLVGARLEEKGATYSPEFVTRYRAAQVARNERITAWVRERLAELNRRGDAPVKDEPFFVYRTVADLAHYDLSIDPSDRQVGSSWGDPRYLNYYAPTAHQGRVSSLRSWLSQWGLHTSNADMMTHIARITAPLLVVQSTSDRWMCSAQMVHDAAGSRDKDLHYIKGGYHLFKGQSGLLAQAVALMAKWLRARGF
ncbi:MAG: alpha/beta hydrolase [Deltaproteobacteria bacterium]|nr:alpha/beta hydrolase [Deltaproteobacteria bacterium]